MRCYAGCRADCIISGRQPRYAQPPSVLYISESAPQQSLSLAACENPARPLDLLVLRVAFSRLTTEALDTLSRGTLVLFLRYKRRRR